MNHDYAMSRFVPEGTVQASVFVVHGMQEHHERYDGFAKYLNSLGFYVVTYDLPGHGETDGGKDRGYFGDADGWNNLVKSAVDIAHMTKQAYPDVPLIYFGHSMGTMIGRCFLQQYDTLIDEMALTGLPNYNSGAGFAKWLAGVSAKFHGKKGYDKMLDNIATGGFNKAIKDPRTPVDWLSYNTENVDAYVADPGCGFPFTVQGYRDLFTGMQQMHDLAAYRCAHKDLPIFCGCGEDDPCVGGMDGFADSVEFLKKVGYSDITTRVWPQMRHEVLHEKDADKVMAAIGSWMESKLQ